jgi:Family of unknown function (DUF5709)
MTDLTPEPDELEDDGVLEPADALDDDDLGADPLDTGVIPPDRWSAGMGFGSTESEALEGESLDQLLAEEEPDIDPYADPDVDLNTDPYADDGTGEQPRAGRLVTEDEGAHSREEPDLVAEDVGIDGGAAGAEEAAVHLTLDEDEDEG